MNGQYSANEVALLWNNGGGVLVCPLEEAQYHKNLNKSGMACYRNIRENESGSVFLKAMCFIEFAHLVIRDGCDPEDVHREMMKISEYVDGCSYDMPLMEPNHD